VGIGSINELRRAIPLAVSPEVSSAAERWRTGAYAHQHFEDAPEIRDWTWSPPDS
jgi:hypothetical protein